MTKTCCSSKKSPSNPLSATRSLHSQTVPISTYASIGPGTKGKPQKSSISKSVAKNYLQIQFWTHNAVDHNDNKVTTKKAWNPSNSKVKSGNSHSKKNHYNSNNIDNNHNDDGNDDSDDNCDDDGTTMMTKTTMTLMPIAMMTTMT